MAATNVVRTRGKCGLGSPARTHAHLPRAPAPQSPQSFSCCSPTSACSPSQALPLPASTSNGLLLTVRHVASHWCRGVLGSALSPYTRPSRDAYLPACGGSGGGGGEGGWGPGGGKGYICVVLSKSSNSLGVCSVELPTYNGLFRVPAGLRAVAFTFRHPRARARG